MNQFDSKIQSEVQRRRTFAIISHPDAGKTTLTEKLLLFGGCLEIAGSVRGRKSQRAATSDWLELEKQRGISVSSTVLPFEYDGYRVNLLDTPGHHDFSEDTYRTLMAADCAVMVIDLAKGVEEQTKKLFRVCAMRRIPVITFVNKVDRTGRQPLEVFEAIGRELNIDVTPQNWPIGFGQNFYGLIDIPSRLASLFDQRDGARRARPRVVDMQELGNHSIPPSLLSQTVEEIELLTAAGVPFDRERFLSGQLSPVYFGSALTNWGVEAFLRGFLKLCPPPQGRLSDRGVIPASRSEFAGFVFKIQANLDPRHRDRVAFLRVCAGHFQRDMEVVHPRTGKRIRLRRALQVFGQDRETLEEGFPGDVIGLVNPGEFRLGDTICVGEELHYEPLPHFSPEFFALLRCPDTSRRKQFERGLTQLLEEGAIQIFTDPHAARREPILAAVGELQFDVARFRLESEYNTPTEIVWLPYKIARWVNSEGSLDDALNLMSRPLIVHDQDGHRVLLFQSAWDANYLQSKYPDIKLSEISTAGEFEHSISSQHPIA